MLVVLMTVVIVIVVIVHSVSAFNLVA